MTKHGVMGRELVVVQEGSGLILAVLHVTFCKSQSHSSPQFPFLQKRIVDHMAIKMIPSLRII